MGLTRIQRSFIAAVLCGVTLHAAADDSAVDKPDWSFEFKGGRYHPSIDGYADYFGRNRTDEISISLARKVFRIFEAGVEVGRVHDKGVGGLPLNNSRGGTVTYDLYPVHAYIALRGVFYENQWVVPYIGGGPTREYYKQSVAGQASAKGHATGTHTRAGVQFLLDRLSGRDAANLQSGFGIENTYLFIEQQTIKAEVKSVKVDLGGKVYLLGLLFEF